VFLLSHRSQDRHVVTVYHNRRQTARQGYTNSVSIRRSISTCSACMKPPPTAYSVAGTGRSSHWRGQAASVKSWSTPEAWVTASMMLEPMPGVSSPTSAGAGDQRSMPVSSPDQIVLCDGKGVCCWPRASPENRCDTLHPQRPPPSAVARRRGRRQVDADSARIGQGRRAGLASAAVNRRRGGGVGDRARRASPVRPGRPGGTPTERPAR
jgi:hypothetical protein